ncbi:MAG: 16S rRNA (adenine(1518)-N(6)/adenine(1519)-N(6))-dimethyltransferase RsmA [Bacteroidales bacterium]|jgi:16S rRNA (adenine1518-N6/adenine1519-N6)-dimethyltransferase|nr:16S rRNA (adenine(1518)-N(6)/adenine(1519)-N(6))-dimethyltransferase RsmA [Bacteroidales bacterium]
MARMFENAVRAKKYLGQHFLKDENIAKQITDSISLEETYCLEIGPGMGVLTKYLLEKQNIKELKLVEIDKESVTYLKENYPMLEKNILNEDFLKMNLNIFPSPYTIIGNFPYNISNQILFKVFNNRDTIKQVVGMFQKEVAKRIASKGGEKNYGILSVLLSAFYDIEYLFEVEKEKFFPPPKVTSAVIKLRRNNVNSLPCDEDFFIRVVKTAFNQRRKMLRQSLKPLQKDLTLIDEETLRKRPEELSLDDFILITQKLLLQK